MIFWNRIDIHLKVGAMTCQEMGGMAQGESFEAMRERVVQTREIQRKCFGMKSRVHGNARMSPTQIKGHYQLDEA